MGNVTFNSRRPEAMTAEQRAKARALEIIGGKAETYAKLLAPVDTGNLRNSITHQQLDEDTEVIGTNVHYAPYQEFGTSKIAAHPYLRPAAENHSEEYKQIWLNELRKG
jgi:HK97 gp10 family phage protein